MAHQVETMAYAGQVPWHGLGVPVSNELTPQQMQTKAGLDWDVYKEPIYIRPETDRMVVPGKKALTRSSDGKIFDVVGDDWNPIQNDEAFAFFNEYVAAGDMEMETAGYYALSKILGHDMISMNAIVANRMRNKYAEDPNQVIDSLIRKVLENI